MSRVRNKGLATHSVTYRTEGAVEYYAKRSGPWPGLPLVETTGTPYISKSMRLNTQESITDEFETPGLFNTCFHTKEHPFVVGAQLCDYKGEDISNLGYSSTRIGQNIGFLNAEFSGRTFMPGYVYPSVSHSEIPWNDLVNQVGTKLDGSMTAGSNLVAVTIVELPKTIKMIKDPFRLISGWRKEAKKLSSKSLAKSAANIWLEARYGWRQFFNDLVNFSKVHKEVKRHIEYLNQITGSWESCGSTHTESKSNWATPRNWGSPTYGGFWFTSECTEAKLTARFTTDIWRDETFRKWSYLELLQQRLGTNNILEVLWELIPFSFCVDWFIDIGRLIKYKPVFWNSHKLRRMGWSIKRELKMSVDIHSRAYTLHPNVCPIHVVHVPEQNVYTSYERHPGFPPESSTVGLFGGLSLTHLADGAALIAQRI